MKSHISLEPIGKNIDPAKYRNAGHYTYYRVESDGVDGRLWDTEFDVQFGVDDQQLEDELTEEANNLPLGPKNEGVKCCICGHRILKAAFITEDEKVFRPIGLDCANSLHIATWDDNAVKGEVLRRRQARIRAEKLDAIEQQYPDLMEALAGSKNKIVADIKERLTTYAAISDKQVGLVRKIYKEERERLEAISAGAIKPVPQGKQTVTLKVTSTKVERVPDPHGWGKDAKRDEFTICFLHEDGWRACYKGGSRAFEALVGGDSVSFTATFEPSARDASFGFISRPSKVKA